IELDQLFIKGINYGFRAIEIRSTAYNPPNDYEEDFSALSVGNAKWVNVEWHSNLISGVHEIEVEFTVKKTAERGSTIPLFYRAWLITEDNEIVRDPTDNSVGNATTMQSRNLYAKAYEKWLEVGNEQVCDALFCYSFSIIDIENELITSVNGEEAYNARNLKEYKLSFTILNNSESEVYSYPNAELEISSPEEDISLGAYTIYRADGTKLTGTAQNYSTGWIEIADLDIRKSVSGSINFITTKARRSPLLVRIKSRMEIKFAHTVWINSLADKEFSVIVEPENIPAGTDKTLLVTVFDKETNVEVEGAIIKIKDRFGNVLVEDITNKLGKASLKVRAQKPGEKLKLIVSKSGYLNYERTIEVSSEVVSFKPKELAFSLNLQTETEQEKTVEITNLTALPLKISEINIVGDFDNAVDVLQVEGWLEPYINSTIAANSSMEIPVRIVLSPEGSKLEKAKSLEGKLVITFSSEMAEWQAELPITISIGLGGQVDDASCLEITKTIWKDSTEGEELQITFNVQNNCTVAGKPIMLRDLSAKIVWKTNSMGTFKLKLGELTKELRAGYGRIFEPYFEGEAVREAILSFTPFGNVDGVAKGEIVFEATNQAENSQKLTASIEFEISAVNLKECVSISKDIITIEPGTTESFEIATKNCGGEVSFELESELQLSKKAFTLNENGSETIEVSADQRATPGQYPIFVKVKSSSKKAKRLFYMIRVKIPSKSCVELSKYEFDIYTKPDSGYEGYDTFYLINKCHDKRIKAKIVFEPSKWKEALKYGFLGAALGFSLQYMQKKEEKPKIITTREEEKQRASETQPQKETEEKPKEGQESSGPQPYIWPHNRPVNESNETGVQYVKSSVKTHRPTAMFDLWPLLLGVGTQQSSKGGSIINPILDVFNKPDPLSWGVLGIVYGIYKANKDKRTIEADYIEKDLELKSFNLYKKGLSAGEYQREDKIEITDLNNVSLRVAQRGQQIERPELTQALGRITEQAELPVSIYEELREMAFINKGNLTQKDPLIPLFRTFRVEGEILEYVTNYKNSIPKHLKLKEEEIKRFSQDFHLQFNASAEEEIQQRELPITSCQLGSLTGATGKEALPRIKLSWDWQDIKEEECDAANENYIYCDATQFSIALVKKLRFIQRFLDKYSQQFICPSIEQAISSAVIQQLSEIKPDIGITKLEFEKKNQTDLNVIMTIANNNSSGNYATSYLITISNIITKQVIKQCSGELQINTSYNKVSCFAPGLEAGDYKIEASIDVDCGSTSCNEETNNDTAEKVIVVGAIASERCEPIKLSRIKEFIEATEAKGIKPWTTQEREKIIRYTSGFTTHLIEDAFSEDFRNDFAEYVNSYGIAQARKDFIESGWYNYFTSNEKLTFLPFTMLKAGRYTAVIEAEFDEDNPWKFFDNNGNPVASISVKFMEHRNPYPDSVFYYLPFDGLVGVGTENGRQGYGINYALETEERVRISASGALPVFTETIPNSTSIAGILSVSKSDDFTRINSINKTPGAILEIERTTTTELGSTTRLIMSPNAATPIL
ncbi:MAG: hypothetical protein J7L14_00490, partial [Candidatus Diapherotrites archaeon]|nr:hypothetical protein [Candidatus Diapherotrites archaeon]